MSVIVPYEGPNNAKILFVGEAPGENEETEQKPFVGPSGQLLMSVLERHGLNRNEVMLANLSLTRPRNNSFKAIDGTEALKKDVDKLFEHIRSHNYKVIVPLGFYPLKYLTDRNGIFAYRGSILPCNVNTASKCVPTLHPSAVLRDRSTYPIFDLDIKRAIGELDIEGLQWPSYEHILDPSGLELEEWVQRLSESEYVSCDIETVKGSSHILCVGFCGSNNPNTGVVIVPNNDMKKVAIQRILGAKNYKIFHNGTFDQTQLEQCNKYIINDRTFGQTPLGKVRRPYYWDTMIAQHVMQPELPRSLAYLTSVYTRQPYYKSVGRDSIPGDDKGWSKRWRDNPEQQRALYEYNSRDVLVTLEIALQQMKELDKQEQERMDYEMRMLTVAHHVGNSGLLLDKNRRELLRRELMRKWGIKQIALDALVKESVNVRSPKLKDILYGKLGLPKRSNRGTVTTDEDAIVSLIQYCKSQISKVKREDVVARWQLNLAVCKAILEIRGLRQLLANYINAECSEDGRMRCIYKVAGTETGRWSSSKYVDGTSYNQQTNPRNPFDTLDLTKLPQAAQDKLNELLSHLELSVEDYQNADESSEDAEVEVEA